MNEFSIKDIILSVDSPCVIRNLKLPWRCFEQSQSEWCNQFDINFPDGVECDAAALVHSEHPQWERNRYKVRRKLNDFLDHHIEEDSKCWFSYSYKNIDELPSECRESISFDSLGFDNIKDISFWFGTNGAHTPCHYDTYGLNIVVQVYGRKMWLLFPPQTNLTPSRVPYEESSVYSQEAFYSMRKWPTNVNFKETRRIILEPGDILIVPNKWWHYVENIETALSINTWIPLDCDIKSHIDECIVKMQVSQLTTNLSVELKEALVNPNELPHLYNEPLIEQINLLQCLIDYQNHKQFSTSSYSQRYIVPDKFNDIISTLNIQWEPVKEMTEIDMLALVEKNARRFSNDIPIIIDENDEYQRITATINSFCDPSVVEVIRMKYEKLNKLNVDRKVDRTLNDGNNKNKKIKLHSN